jgi:hypothetical protein
MPVNGNKLLRKPRRLARRRKTGFEFDPSGHGLIVFGSRRTILWSSRHKDLPSGSLRGLLSDLAIDPKDLG